MARRCAVCGGSGKAMGGGSIPTICDACDGGIVREEGEALTKKESTIKLDKRSKQYKQAVQNMVNETGCSEDKARELLDAEMDKL